MACVPEYLYGAIFEQYGKKLEELLLDSNEDTKSPYPIYASREAYDADTISEFKGILVWDAQRYYSGLTADPADYESYPNDVGFYIVPEFGNVSIIPNVEFKQYITISFDSNSEPDKDKYGVKIIQIINWFVNRHERLIEALNIELITSMVVLDVNGEPILDDQGNTIPVKKPLWSMLDSISKPIYSNSIYIRRNVTEVVRYCRCS